MIKTKTFIALSGALFCCGCNVFGPILSETFREQKIPAEFRLADNAKGGVLVLIDESRASGSYYGFRSELAGAVKGHLVKKVRLKEEYLKWQGADSTERPGDDLSVQSPLQAGKNAGVALVLYIWIQELNLYDIDGRGFFEGSLVSRSVLIDTASGAVVWPISKEPKLVKARVNLETDGKQETLDRLTATTAHCISRNFYACPKDKFRASDEYRILEMNDW